MSESIEVLGIPGSLRKNSFNRALLRAAAQLMPIGAVLKSIDLEGIPPFNQDHEATPPDRVKEFKARIRAADAVLFATPEYNYSLSGVLKNAIDWASRPYGDSAWQGKPAAIMGASIGSLGTARAQYHLRQILVTLDMPTVNQPEVMVSLASDRFDERGDLTDEESKRRIAKLLQGLVELTRKFKSRS